MAYIVEMQNGYNNKLEIMGLDDRGEMFVEKIVYDGDPDPNFRRFCCSGDNWKKSIELGKKMGWVPTGTILEKTLNLPEKKYSDYDPPSVVLGEDYKIFTEQDAKNFAEALVKAVDLMQHFDLKEYGNDSTVLLKSAMTEEEFKSINRNMDISFLKEFAVFLHKGQFSFNWDD